MNQIIKNSLKKKVWLDNSGHKSIKSIIYKIKVKGNFQIRSSDFNFKKMALAWLPD